MGRLFGDVDNTQMILSDLKEKKDPDDEWLSCQGGRAFIDKFTYGIFQEAEMGAIIMLDLMLI